MNRTVVLPQVAAKALMRRTRALFWLWVVVILAIVVPWRSFQPHSHWDRVGWIAFVSPPVRFRDVILNSLLYLPFGYWHGGGSGKTRWLRTAGWALVLSISTELTQVFAHGRFPSATDVVANVAGAIWGNLWGRRRARR
jgi:glycopeptide antibiotics resistance protein